MDRPGLLLVVILVLVLAVVAVGPYFTTGGGWQLMPLHREPGRPWGPRHHLLVWIGVAVIVAVLLNLAGII